MLELDILGDFHVLLGSFIFYFLSIILFGITRYIMIGKSVVLISCLTIINILYQYYYFFRNFTFEDFNFYVKLTNFSQNVSLVDFNLSFQLNSLTFMFSLLVLIIGFCTNIYTLNYFKNEADEMGFLFWLNSFVLSMVLLILAENFITLFLGWELIGFTSFFLINFWQSRRATLKSSFKAFSFNLVSDLFLLASLVILYINFHTTSINGVLTQANLVGCNNSSWLSLSVILLILCASIKSVQIFGHLWLPDSMEAPVPASSLIHSATLVSAGVFILLRFNELIFLVNYQGILVSLGSITAAYGGVVAAAQTDVKKLLAYSTMSHCGFLFILVGLGDFYITLVYLFLHGLFKASTFFCVGSLIRVYGTQDTRLMGGAARILWGDTILLLICSANLCGLPFSVGITYKLFFFKALLSSNFHLLDIGFIYIALLSSLIYFYRLIAYSIFDRWKMLWGTNPFLSLAIKSRGIKDKRIRLFYDVKSDLKTTTFGHWFAIFIIMIAVFYTYFILLYFNITIIKDDNVVWTHNFNSNFLGIYFTNFYTCYLIYFYMFYLIIFFIISLLTWRKNFFFFDKLYVSMYILLILVSFIFFIKMWGSTLTEANTLTNFNFGFSTYKSDILLHLSQWQYWWWFWFSLFWAVYFFIIIRLLNKRSFAFNPILNTSIRGHGKWGDFLVALIPLSWCGNILVNSNFILRMIEWQNESSLFTIRVQGKQWYWVYKFDANAAQSIYAAPKNIGHNRWFVLSPMESYCVDTYYQALNLGTQLEFKTLYYKYLSNDGLTINTLNNNSLQTANEKMSDSTKVNIYKPHVENYTKMRNKEDFLYKFINNKFANIKNLPKVNFILNNKYNDLHENLNNNLNSIYATSKYNNNLNTNTAFYDYDQIDDLSNFAGNMDQQTNTKPLFFVRGILNTHVTEILTNNFEKNNILNKDDILSYSLNKLKQFNTIFKSKKTIEKKEEISLYENLIEANMYINKIKYIKPVEVVKPIKPIETKRINLQQFKNFIGNVTINTFDVLKEKNTLNKPLLFNILFNNNSGAVQKIDDNELLWGFRQKKYKRFKKFFFSNKINYDPNTLLPIKTEKNVARQLKNNIITNFEKYDDVKNIEYHNSVKFNRHRSELVPVNLARRLLRTKRTLVLPAHVNITLISNSYDVVHSWFIPGLGLKIDCVPGRSTHHTFYIDNIGFYYGQCAEICGRYHHHMPIRLCALSFDHFLVWWQKKGLRRLHRFTDKNSSGQKQLHLHGSSGSLMK